MQKHRVGLAVGPVRSDRGTAAVCLHMRSVTVLSGRSMVRDSSPGTLRDGPSARPADAVIPLSATRTMAVDSAVRKRVRAGALLLAISICVACDRADSRTTARVASIDREKVCIVPEDRSQADLESCFPYRPQDRSLLGVGRCISVVVPDSPESKERGDPIRSISVLGRPCKR